MPPVLSLRNNRISTSSLLIILIQRSRILFSKTLLPDFENSCSEPLILTWIGLSTYESVSVLGNKVDDPTVIIRLYLNFRTAQYYKV